MALIRAYLIHHNDPDRLPQREAITDLLAQLQIPLTPIVEQAPNAPLLPGWRGRWAVLGRECFKRTADFQQRRLRQPRLGLELHLRQLWKQLQLGFCLLCSPPAVLQQRWRHNQVELIVTDKHVRAWRLAVAASAEVALVFEDDVICQPGSLQRLQQVLQQVLRHQGLYVDLAGGYRLDAVLPLDQARPGPGWAEIWLPAVHTNTACAYLASVSLVHCWLQALQRRPALAQLPIDHLINRASALEAPQIGSVHWCDPPFRHGSCCGLVRSWQQ